MNILYQAQTQSQSAVQVHIIPRKKHSDNYSSFTNSIHDFLNFLEVTAYSTVEKIKQFTNWFFQDFQEMFFHLNPIDNKYHFSLIPPELELWFGTLVFLILGYSTETLATVKIPTPKTEGIAPESPVLTKVLVQKIVDQIVTSNKALVNPQESFSYETHVVATTQLNAFCLPGGRMVVFQHLLEQIYLSITNNCIQDTTITLKDGSLVTICLKDITFEDVIASLLAHEITHAASRHSSFAFSFDTFLFWILSPLPEDLASLLHHLFALYRSRSCEYEADVTGAFLAQKAGYNPRGALYLQEFFKTVTPNIWRYLLALTEPISTHPSTNSRLVALVTALAVFAKQDIQQNILCWSDTDDTLADLDQEALSPAVLTARALRQKFSISTRPPVKEAQNENVFEKITNIVLNI